MYRMFVYYRKLYFFHSVAQTIKYTWDILLCSRARAHMLTHTHTHAHTHIHTHPCSPWKYTQTHTHTHPCSPWKYAQTHSNIVIELCAGRLISSHLVSVNGMEKGSCKI